jgi:hypothetical protein
VKNHPYLNNTTRDFSESVLKIYNVQGLTRIGPIKLNYNLKNFTVISTVYPKPVNIFLQIFRF